MAGLYHIVVGAYLHRIAQLSRPAKLFLFGQFLVGLGSGILTILMTLYLRQHGYGETFIGQTLSVMSIGSLLFAFPLSFFMDRHGVKRFVVAGGAACSLGIVGIAFWPTPLLLAISCFLMGTGTSLIDVGVSPFYMRHAEPDQRPFLFGFGTAVGPASALAGGALIWILSLQWGEGLVAQRHMLLVGASIVALGAATLCIMRENVAPLQGNRRRSIDLRIAFKVLAPASIIGLGAGITIPFISLYFRHRFGYGPQRISAVYSAAQVVSFFAFLLAPILARRFGGIRTIVACQLLSLPFFLILALTLSPTLAIFGFLARHALMNMAAPVLSHFIMELVPPDRRAVMSAARELSWEATCLLGTLLGGWLIEHTRLVHDGFSVGMFVTIGLYVAGSTSFYACWRHASAITSVPGARSIEAPAEAPETESTPPFVPTPPTCS